MQYLLPERLFDGEFFHVGMAVGLDGDRVATLCQASEVPEGAIGQVLLRDGPKGVDPMFKRAEKPPHGSPQIISLDAA